MSLNFLNENMIKKRDHINWLLIFFQTKSWVKLILVTHQ